jgi:hypothetical protein
VDEGWKAGLIALLLVAAAACFGGRDDERSMRTAAATFYNTYLKLHPSGIPDKKQHDEFAPALSAALNGLLSDAAGAEESYAKATKGESPPLVEGDLFTSLFEGAETYAIGACTHDGDAASCLIDLAYTDQRDKSKVVWQDRLYLVRDGNKWLVDDIEFLGTWEFMHKGRLKDLLQQVIEEAKDAPAP